MSHSEKSISDEIRVIRVQAETNPTILLIQAVTRALLAVIVTASGAYLLISQIPIPESAIPIAILILGAYFGVEGVTTYLRRNGARARG